MDHHGGGVFDPKGEAYKIEWLAGWAVKDQDCNGPVDFLNLLAKLAPEAQKRYPKLSFLDSLYRTVRMSEAYRNFMETIK